MQNKIRLAVVVSHPIQHFCPQYVSFSKHPGLQCKVFFASALGLKKYIDPNFKREISWGNLQLEKFDHVFLNGDNVLQPDKNLDAPSLDSALAEYQPQIIITYGYFQKLQQRAHSWARKNKVKMAYISDSEKRQRRPWLKELLKYPFLRLYFSPIQFFLSVGDANEDFYRFYGVPEKKLIRMHFPIDIYSYENSFQQRIILRQQIRQRYNIGENEMVTAVVGKLVPWKNQGYIIDALQLLEEEGINLHLFVIGSGDMEEELRQKAALLKKSKVHFPGFVNIEELPGYYAAADFYTHPAAIEPHSIAISEAIYMGTPIVISDRCGSYGERDDVQHEKNGIVYPFGDTRSLADSIKKMCLTPGMLKEMGEYSHELAQGFQKQSHAGVLTDLIKACENV
jgi:glycosyltransferase involved in cell wall biosynthesis